MNRRIAIEQLLGWSGFFISALFHPGIGLLARTLTSRDAQTDSQALRAIENVVEVRHAM